jgi:hypothetical protein
METIHYKKHLIILDGQGYWNSNTLTNGDITATFTMKAMNEFLK